MRTVLARKPESRNPEYRSCKEGIMQSIVAATVHRHTHKMKQVMTEGNLLMACRQIEQQSQGNNQERKRADTKFFVLKSHEITSLHILP